MNTPSLRIRVLDVILANVEFAQSYERYEAMCSVPLDREDSN